MRKRLTSILLAFCLSVSLIASMSVETQAAISEDVYKNYTGRTYYDQEEDCFIYQTEAVLRTTDWYYKTLRLQFSRIREDATEEEIELTIQDKTYNPLCSYDPHYYTDNVTYNPYWTVNGKQREYILVDPKTFTPYEHTYTENGVEKTIYTYTIPREDIFDLIEASFPDWGSQLKEDYDKGETIYIGVDNVITMVEIVSRNPDGTYTEDDLDEKGYIESGTYRGTIYDWSNWDHLQNDWNWVHEETKTDSIPSNYNNILLITRGSFDEVIEGDDAEEEETASTGGTCVLVKNLASGSNIESGNGINHSGDMYAAPNIRTYNTDDEFDIGVAIPTTEGYTNGIEIDSWYGHINVTNRYVGKTYSVPYDLTVEVARENSSFTCVIEDTADMVGTTVGDTSYLYVVSSYANPLSSTGTSYVIQIKTTWTTYDKYNYSGSVAYAMDPVNYYYISGINLLAYEYSKVTNTFATTNYTDKASVPYDITINGSNKSSDAGTYFSTTTFAPIDSYHVQWPDASDFKVTGTYSESTIQNTQSAVELYVTQQFHSYINAKDVIIKNDELEIDGTTYLTKNNVHFNFVSGQMTEMAENPTNDKVTGEKGVIIPELTPNGYYYTTITAQYKKFAAGNMLEGRKMTIEDTAGYEDAILTGYEQNEPIVVHSPVVSPILIVGELQTQLIEQEDATQLLLDNTYTAIFDWNKYFHYKGYTQVAGFTKYVKKKEVRFPFSVMMNDVYYETSLSTGFTDWIDIGIVEEFDFYIPTWANEGVYGVEGYAGYDANDFGIQVRVYANNSTSLNNMEEYTYNDYLQSYVATYEYPVQVSGHIYDFEVTAINDSLTFDNNYDLFNVYSFVSNKEERRVGTTNRFGENNVRYTMDGTLTDNWSILNTVPFTSGKTNVADEIGSLMGFLQKGHEIGFTFKTISSLNNDDDTVVITPSYRYVAPDGSVSDVNVYYSMAPDYFMKAGSTKDYENTKAVRLADEYFKNAYYDYGPYDTIQFTADYYGKSKNAVLYMETDSYNLGNITLYSTQKLLTGDEEELYVNKDAASADAIRYNELNGLGNLTDTVHTQFRASMQTWYGRYRIPGKLYVVKKNPTGSIYEDAHQEQIQTYGYCATDDDYWLTDGYLILNFDIKTYANGQNPHLTYYGGWNGMGINMWETESKNDPDTSYVRDVFEVDNITLESGDVAIISLDTSLMDYRDIGILYLN